MTLGNHHCISTGIVFALVFAFASPGLSQSSKPGRDSAAINRKIQQSANLQRQALEALSDPARAEKLVKNAYVQLKSAHDDLVINSTIASPPDALLNLSTRKAYEALTHVQGAVDALSSRDRTGAETAIGIARDRLQQALRITNTLAATGF